MAQTEVNPALKFLQDACALFYGHSQKGEDMRCPHCSHDIAELWQALYTVTDDKGQALRGPEVSLDDADDEARFNMQVEWMKCHNERCGRLIIRICGRRRLKGTTPMAEIVEPWFALPKRPTPRPIDPLVPSKYAAYYRQASLVLDDSPSASAAMSRRVLADLLADYGHYNQGLLSKRVDAFIEDRRNPRSLRENLHYLREIADFGVHTQKDSTDGTIIEVGREEADWGLDILDRLFEYYVVSEKRSATMRSQMDDKISQAGRKSIRPLPKDS